MERAWIEQLAGRIPLHQRVALGVGDDAAVVTCEGPLVVSTDLLMDGVHYELASTSPRRVGHKALAVNLSDLAAMGASPVAAVVSLALPRAGGFELASGLYDGLLPLAERYDCPIVGGDTNCWDGPLVISVAIWGTPGPGGLWRRAGVRAGDRLLVSGPLGGSILGHHLDFQPRVELANWLSRAYPVRAATDISDGLSVDARHLAESSGCGLVLRAAQIPLTPAAWRRAEQTLPPEQSCQQDLRRARAIAHALHDGEDFELLLAVEPNAAQAMLDDPRLAELAPELAEIGWFTVGSGVWLETVDGQTEALPPLGFEH